MTRTLQHPAITPRQAGLNRAARVSTPAGKQRPRPTSLSQLWLGAMAEEERDTAPFERMGLAVMAIAAAAAITASFIASARFVDSKPALMEWVGRLLG
jgi:hypothetical protein